MTSNNQNAIDSDLWDLFSLSIILHNPTGRRLPHHHHHLTQHHHQSLHTSHHTMPPFAWNGGTARKEVRAENFGVSVPNDGERLSHDLWLRGWSAARNWPHFAET